MKKIISVLGGPLFIGLLMLVAYAAPVSAHSTSSPNHLLPISPVSASVLVARGIRNGTIHPKGNAPGGDVITDLKCKPAPCVLPNKQASEGGRPANEVPVAANPKSKKDLLTGANDYNCSNVQGFYSSSNGGKKWTTHCLDSFMGGFGEGDPGVGYDLNGNSYITGIDGGTPDGSDIIFEKSSNNGQTWSAPAAAVKPLFPRGLTDKDWLQIDDNASSPHANALYISVSQFDSSETNTAISVSHSFDGGSTWTTVQVDPEQFFPNIDQFSDLAIGKDGTVYVSWMRCTANGPTGDCGGTVAKEVVSKSTDGGNTWSAPVTIASVNLTPDSCGAFYGCIPGTSERVSNIPAIDIDNSSGANSGHLYAVFYNWTGSQMQVEVATSTNGGSTWGAPVRVSTAANDEFFPWLTVSPTGVIGVTWNDRRNDPNNHNYEEFGAVTTNSSNFGTNYQVASQASNPNNDGFGGGFMGDYTGNYWDGKTLYAVWTDTRSGINGQDFIGGIKNNA